MKQNESFAAPQWHVVTGRAATILCFALLVGACLGQGTMTLRFEGQPRGTLLQTGSYSEGGIQFRAVPFGALYLSGGGVTGFPENGTGYLIMPDHDFPSNGLEFGSADNITLFNLVSFDAAEHGNLGATDLTVVGYKPQIMGPMLMITNVYTLDGINDGTGPLEDFQTLSFDSSWANLLRVDVFARFSIDNLVISGVPEPSTGSLGLLGAAFLACSAWMKKKRV